MKKLLFLILVVLIGGGGYIFLSPTFEKIPPKIEIKTNGYTNLKEPILIEISDSSGIKEISVVVVAKGYVKEIVNKKDVNIDNLSFKVKLPKDIHAENIKLIVRAVDRSRWNFFAGNEAKKEVSLKVDKLSPEIEIVNNSYAIGRGGSAAIVVKVADKNLADYYIEVNKKYKFKLTPFYKENYYVALIAWPIWEKNFDAKVVAKDLANNVSFEHIPLYWKTKGIYRLKKVKINVPDWFINRIAKKVLIKMGINPPQDPIEIFKLENEKVRKINEEEIYSLTKDVLEEKINSFSIARFNPLPGSAKKADFGEYRHYYYKGEEISRAIHKGIDLAKIKRAKIYSSNYAKVVARKYIGIYGNTLILYHKLGLYSLYAHTSEFLVRDKEVVKRNQVIAKTGSTGGVFGDHLHFGIYIQGIPVQPLEWMDRRWIKLNIINVINGAKKLINQN